MFDEEIKKLFNRRLGGKVLVALIGSMGLGLYRSAVGGFRYYDFFALLFSVTAVLFLVPLFVPTLSKETVHPHLRLLSLSLLFFSAVWASRPLLLSGFPIPVMFAFFFALALTKQKGSVVGAFAGLFFGAAYRLAEAPGYLLAALVYGLMKERQKEMGGVFAAAMTAFAWSVYASGLGALSTHLPALLIGGTAFSVVTAVKNQSNGKGNSQTAKRSGKQTEHTSAESRHGEANDRFRAISEAFSNLSEVFYNLSDRFRRPGAIDLRRICDESFDAFCAECPSRSVCWGLEYSAMLSVTNRLISALHKHGKVTRDDLAEGSFTHCSDADSILDRINADCAKLTEEMLKNNRTEIFAMDYESAAKIINDALDEEDGEYRTDTRSEERIREYLSDAGISARSVSVYGERRRRILLQGVDLDQAKVSVETLRQDLGEMCDLEFDTPFFEREDGADSLFLQTKKKIAVYGAQNNVSADGGVSGDSVVLFSNQKDYFYALINDGMGSGKEAAFTSNLCSVFLEKMLRAGNRANTSIRMLNNLVRSRTPDSTFECSSTVDLLELDLMTAEAAFIKSGAAPSYVVRKNTVHRFQAGTAPIGIICKVDSKTADFAVKPGDTVVMISDGVLQDDPKGAWLTSFLSGASELEPEDIVYRVCHHAAKVSEHHDDLSCIALRIAEEETE